MIQVEIVDSYQNENAITAKDKEEVKPEKLTDSKDDIKKDPLDAKNKEFKKGHQRTPSKGGEKDQKADAKTQKDDKTSSKKEEKKDGSFKEDNKKEKRFSGKSDSLREKGSGDILWKSHTVQRKKEERSRFIKMTLGSTMQ